jgi:hypothetical protein
MAAVVHLLPHNPDAWQSLGLALEAAKRDDEAAAAFQQATRLRPESVVSMNSLAELYAREGHPKKPRVSFNRSCGKNLTGVRPTWVWAKPLRPWAKLRKQRHNSKKRSRTASTARSLTTPWQSFRFPGAGTALPSPISPIPCGFILPIPKPRSISAWPWSTWQARRSQGSLRGSRPFATQFRRGPFLSWFGTGKGR